MLSGSMQDKQAYSCHLSTAVIFTISIESKLNLDASERNLAKWYCIAPR